MVTGWDDYDPGDDWDDDYESPAEQAAAEDRALDRHIEEQAAEEYWQHCDEEHGGRECDCPVPEWPSRCRLLLRVPRWFPGRGWRCGTPALCGTARYRSPWAALRAHRQNHVAPF